MLEHMIRNARRRRPRAARLPMAPRRRLPRACRAPAGSRPPAASVYIVAPEQSLRFALARNLRQLGVDARPFADSTSFAAALPELEPGCVLLDTAALTPPGTRLPGDFRWRRLGWPTILMFGSLDAEDAVRAMRLGASDVLRKPIPQDELMDALHRVAPKLREHRLYDASMRARQAIESLSPRERDVIEAMKEGLSNKHIARALGLSHRTVEMHRSNIHRKLGVASLAQLLKIAWLAHGLGEPGHAESSTA